MYVVATAVRLLLVYQDAVAAERSLLQAEASLRQEGLDISERRLAEVEAKALTARSRFASARRFLEGEPLFRLVRQLPWFGRQVEAASALASIGQEGSEVALAGVGAVNAFDDAAAADGETPGERAVAFLAAVRPQMQAVQDRLESIREQRRVLDGPLLPPLAALASAVDRRLPPLEELVAKYRAGDAVAAALLGYQRPRTYLIVGQDNTELMPGGGIIGVYGLITVDRGRLTESAFADVEEAIVRWQADSGGEYVEPPRPLKRYLLRDWTWNLSLAGWSPHFPEAARRLLFFFERAGGGPVDGVVAIDFTALERMLSVLGPVTVDEVTVTAETVTEETLARTRGAASPGKTRHAFAIAVASQVVERALTAERDKWWPLLETLDRLAEGKHLAMYASEPPSQRRLGELGWAGEVSDGPGDYLQVVEASVHSTKLNLALQQRAQLAVRLDGDGHSRNTVIVHYRNDLDGWAQGRDRQRVRDLMLSGFYGDYVRLLAPPAATLEEVRLNGREVGAEEVALEAGRASFGRYLPLPRGKRATLAFSYEVPAAVIVSGGQYEYRLRIQKQAGARTMPLSIVIRLPEGASPRNVSLDGEPLAGRPLRLQVELDRDRELVVRYGR